MITRLTENDFIFAGAMYFIMAIIAMWLPWPLLTGKWCLDRYKQIRAESRPSVDQDLQLEVEASPGDDD
jgi:hypothetical protein